MDIWFLWKKRTQTHTIESSVHSFWIICDYYDYPSIIKSKVKWNAIWPNDKKKLTTTLNSFPIPPRFVLRWNKSISGVIEREKEITKKNQQVEVQIPFKAFHEFLKFNNIFFSNLKFNLLRIKEY